ncbi:MAG: hydroxymethylbilane synthase [Gemmatimonadaceae bacterium]|nr:hydroxymethylbilane synthase [Gemmatimonadaceae bacterium]
MTLDLDVILAAHGAGDASEANDRVRRWARDLEASQVGVRVLTAFHQGTPSYDDALDAADRAHRIVIPCLTSDGFHAARLREAAARAVERSGRPIHVAAPIGTSGAVVLGIAHRVRERLRAVGGEPSRTLIIVVGHGTARFPGSAEATREIVRALPRLTRARAEAAFLDEFPTVEDAITGARGYRTLIVAPFLVGGGAHATADLPARIRAASATRGDDGVQVVAIDPPGDAEMMEAFEGAIDEGRPGRTVVRAGARDSQLSRRQVELFARAVAPLGVDVRLRSMSTAGDLDQETPLSSFPTDDPFTGTIDAALLAGTIDVAVHSLKDLPLDRPGDVHDTYLPRGSAFDVLVSTANVALDALPPRARIGVSCRRRARQVQRLRPDVQVVAIRGAVPDRLAALDRGDYDALVLAEAGLERLGLASRIAQRFAVTEVTPAPGQGAIVVRCRADSSVRFLLRQVEDRATRLAVQAELAFARHVSGREGAVAAALATVRGEVIELRARRLDRDGGVLDRTVSDVEPEAVARAAADFSDESNERLQRGAR